MEKEKLLNEIDQAYEEAKSAWKPLFDQEEEDDEFYANKQWNDTDLALAARKQAPTLSINYLKKQVDVLYGYQSQNQTDIKCFPIDGGDVRIAEVYSRVIKWIMTDRDNNNIFGIAFKDGIRGGMGWVCPEIYYENDPVNGDICLNWESRFNILPDPFFKKKDLSDAHHIIRHKKINKKRLAALYPSKKEEILKITSKFDNDGIRKEIIVPNDKDDQILVMEYWYKEYKDINFLIKNNVVVRKHEGSKEELEQMLSQDPELSVRKQKVPIIKLVIKAEDVILYEGKNPYDTSCYPFVPIFCFYDPSLETWQLRVQGIIRSLKDSQREMNKTRSILMQAVMKMPNYGWKMTEGAVEDLNSFKAQSPLIIQTPGSSLEQIVPPQIPQGVFTVHQMFEQSLTRIGLNADSMGQVEEKGSPGVAIQQRIKQSLLSHQEVFDNFHFAKKLLGRIFIELIVKNFSREKILRILGEDLIFVPDELKQQVQQSAQIAQQMIDQLENEKAKLQQDVDRMEQQGQQLSEEQQMGLVQQLNQMEQQAQQAVIQSEQLQAELAMKQSEEKDFWAKWEATKTDARFDTTIDETASNPTYRISAFNDVMQAVQYGIPVPPETVVSLMELPADVKKRTFESIQQNQQMQAQMAQMQQQKDAAQLQLEQQRIQGQMQVELIKQGIDPKTLQPIQNQQTEEKEPDKMPFFMMPAKEEEKPKEEPKSKKRKVKIERDNSGRVSGAEIEE